jgi:hypothetical protein
LRQTSTCRERSPRTDIEGPRELNYVVEAPLLVAWWAELGDDLLRIFPDSLWGLPQFLRQFAPPARTLVVLQEDPATGAGRIVHCCWGGPVLGCQTFNWWIAPAWRQSPRALRWALESLRMMAEGAPVLLCATQERRVVEIGAQAGVRWATWPPEATQVVPGLFGFGSAGWIGWATLTTVLASPLGRRTWPSMV